MGKKMEKNFWLQKNFFFGSEYIFFSGYSHEQFLVLNDGVSLQSLKVVLLVRSMLVHDEEVVAQLGNDEAEVELQGE